MNHALYYPLPQPVIFRVEGKDATRYLHARLTNAIKGLPIGLSCRAAALTPQGKTEALFTCVHTAESGYLLQCDGGDPELLRAGLCRYIVADRVTVELVQDALFVLHASSSAKEQLCSVAGVAPTEALHQVAENQLGIHAIIPASRLGFPGFDIWIKGSWSSASAVKSALATCEELDAARFEEVRLTHGSPMFPNEINQEHLFTEAPVGSAIGRNKGCYVGQEVVERIESRGATPRMLARFFCKGFQAIAAETPVFCKHPDGSQERVGEVYSSALSEEGVIGFASIRRQADPAQPIYLNDLEGHFTWVSED